MVSIASPGGRVPASGALGQIGLVALVSGTVASVTSSAALALLAKAEGRNAVQPLNATSHWVHGEDAGSVREVDLDHTAVGYATHHAASVFWAFLFESLQAARAERNASRTAKNAALVAAIAAVVDYGVVPKRLTPGWEEVLSASAITGGYVATALGLMLGGMLTGGSAIAYDKDVRGTRDRRQNHGSGCL